MKIHFFLFIILLASALYSCSSDEEITDPETDDLVWDTGRNDFNFMVDGNERHVAVHIPSAYSHSENVPVVFMLHGTGGNGNKFYNISKWVQKSEEIGFIAVFPTAIEYPLIDGSKATKWSSDGLFEQLAEGTEVVDDIKFLEHIINQLTDHLKIDERRMYICGFSNGSGFVKSEVIPRMSHVFAAANVTGGVGIPLSYNILGNRIMPVFNIAGSKDPKIFEKLGTNEELPLHGIDLENHEFLWEQITVFCGMLGLNSSYSESPNPPKWNQLTFSMKANSNASAEYILMMVNDMPHVFPNGTNNPQDVVAVNILWPWFEKWTL